MAERHRALRLPTVPPALSNGLLALMLLLFVRSSLGAAALGNLGALLLAVQEGCAAILVLCRRGECQADRTPTSALIAWLGTLLPLLFRPAPALALRLVGLGTALQFAGGMLAILATVRLGRSFSVVAANRGVKTSGLYRLVRHPIYAAYVLIFGGFVLAHPSAANVLVLLVWLWAQRGRILAEERMLAQNEAYRVYQQRVRYRLLPNVW